MCYDCNEVNFVENQEFEQEQEQMYTPRPAWQVWAARIGLVLFVAVIVMYYIHMMRGGI